MIAVYSQVIHALHSHIGSGIQAETDAALDALINLVSEPATNQMLQASQAHLKPLLDYTSSFGDDQIWKVFTLFAKLECQNDLVILTRKQLGNTELQYKRVGIIGAVTLCTCCPVNCTQETQVSCKTVTCYLINDSSRALISLGLSWKVLGDDDNNVNADLKDLLHVAMAQCQVDVMSRSLLYVELCKSVKRPDTSSSCIAWLFEEFNEG